MKKIINCGGYSGCSPLDIRNARSLKVSIPRYCCPACGGSLKFGSRDPCEGDAYWCTRCDFGPVWFPLGEGPRPVPAIIDSETSNAALILVAALKRFPVNTEGS